MYRLYSFVMILFTVNFVYAQNECNDCLKIEVIKNDYYDGYKKILNGYIVDERGDTFDYNLLDLKLTFSKSNANYMVFPGVFDPIYYQDSIFNGSSHSTNLDSFAQIMPYSLVLIENQQGDIKILSTRPEKVYPASDNRIDLSVGFYRSFKISDDSIFSMQIRIRNNSLKIKESDTLLRFHYLYRPSIGYLRDYYQRKVSLTLYTPYADSARCSDCSNVDLTSNWFELTTEKEVRIIKKEAIDDLLSSAYRSSWPSKDNLQGNGLYYLIFNKVKYFEDKILVLPVEGFGHEDISAAPLDSSNRPIQLLIPERGLILNVYNQDQNDSNTGFIYSILLDLEGRHIQSAYRDQLPMALNYGDKLSDLKRRYRFSKVNEETRYIYLFLDHMEYGSLSAKITYDQVLQRITEVEMFFGENVDSF